MFSGTMNPSSLRFVAAMGTAALLSGSAVGCHGEAGLRGEEVGHGAPRSAAAASGGVIDSALSLEEELRRFRADLGAEPTGLDSPYRSRDELVAAFAKAAARFDTLTLQSLHISRSEFAYFYFPASEFAREPYRLPPALVWFQITAGGGKGLNKTVQLLSTAGAQFDGYTCATAPKPFGNARLWQDCNVSWLYASGERHSARLFGSILEHGGRYKFVSYSNGL
jgi:hypothetical protein